MADIKLVIKIDEEMYEALRKQYVIFGGLFMSDLHKALAKGEPLPKGQYLIITESATNCDVIKAVFPCGIKIDRSTAYAKRVTEDWLNAPYEGEIKE